LTHPHQWLQAQSAHWERDGLISADQAERLRQRHPPPAFAERVRSILTVLGALLLGLGVILLFAYNWADMHRHIKLVLVLATLALAHGTAMVAGQRDKTALSEGMHALGTMLFGAGIWLIAQMYHIDDHYPNAFLLWGLGAFTLAWALPSVMQALLAAALVITWQATELFDFRAAVHGAPWVVLIGLLPLVGRLNSPFLGSISAAALLGSLALNAARTENDSAMIAVFFVGTALSALGLLLAQTRPAATAYRGMAGPGFVLIVTLLFVLGFPEAADELGNLSLPSLWDDPWLPGALLLSLTLWAALLGHALRSGSGVGSGRGIVELAILGGHLLLLWLLLTPLKHQGDNLSMLFNLLYLATAAAMIVSGARSHRKRLLGVGVALVLVLAVFRYLDLFDSLLERALAFLVAGALLFIAGLMYRRRKGREAEP
jgi:uncharacterized membrane protein